MSKVEAISARLSLREPQRRALEILEKVCQLHRPEKGADLAKALAAIRAEFPTVTDFEREFPSLCFALATGVGKTRLMGAFIAYLYQAQGIRDFLVLAPNLTIYNKLIADFTPNTPKYVFQGIADFATETPEIVTGDNYESGRGVRRNLFHDERVHINIFNISKLNSEVRGGKSPRIKRLAELIGESYFDYLSKLDDLVLLMDESHRYRASAGVKAINELKPILGLELTATPQDQQGAKTEDFKNIIYSYPLSEALKDGFVKEPAVATREDFNPKAFTPDRLERLKLEDGVRIHEETKVQLEVYARERGLKTVKPFMLVVAADTNHANDLVKTIESDAFFDGHYKGRVIPVHSNQSGEEKDENIQLLLAVEDPANPTEIVVHVNMLKEGWDVTNLYTIVPLRSANSKTLVEQSIGRGLRLPYGKRTGVVPVDRLTIVSHDRFQDIIDEANKPDSIIKTGVVIGKDIPEKRSQTVEIRPEVERQILGTPTASGGFQGGLFEHPKAQEAAKITLDLFKEERLPSASDLLKPEVQKRLVDRVQAAMGPSQQEFPEMTGKGGLAQVVRETSEKYVALSIDIPRIIVAPKGNVVGQFKPFTLDLRAVRYMPVAKDILIKHLRDHGLYRLVSGDGIVEEKRLEDYLVKGLIIECDDINYDDHADLLYGLASQVVKHLKGYLKSEEDVKNVLQYHQKPLVDLIHAQLLEHEEVPEVEYEAHVSRGFNTLRPGIGLLGGGEALRNFRQPVADRVRIRSMVFTGFSRCLYDNQKFDSDPERRFAVVLEDDKEVLKWIRPIGDALRILHGRDEEYEPDFVVETKAGMLLCEVKDASEMKDKVVLQKAEAAALWCHHATQHAKSNGGKPWAYLLIPDSAVLESATLRGLAGAYTYAAGRRA